MLGDLPPSSKVTFFRLDEAAAFIMVRPTTVEPVKATLSMSMWEEMAAPATLPKPEIRLKTPGGKPASLIRLAKTSADRGVCSADFMTMVLPVASAGPIFQESMRSGKFQGMIWPQTPSYGKEVSFLPSLVSFQLASSNVSKGTCQTYGLWSGVVKHVGGNVDSPALDLVGPSTIVSDAASNSTNVTPGHGNGLAIVERLYRGEEVDVLLNEIGKLDHQDGSLLGSNLLPGGFESLAGGGDSNVDILLGGFTDRGNDFFSGGVDDLKSLLVNTLNPLVVDETGGDMAVSFSDSL